MEKNYKNYLRMGARMGDLGANQEKFVVGDDVIYSSNFYDNLPKHAADFLRDRGNGHIFQVLRINGKGKIDLGCFRMEGNKKFTFYFSPIKFSRMKYVDEKPKKSTGDFDISTIEIFKQVHLFFNS